MNLPWKWPFLWSPRPPQAARRISPWHFWISSWRCRASLEAQSSWGWAMENPGNMMLNPRKTMGKWWFNGILWDLMGFSILWWDNDDIIFYGILNDRLYHMTVISLFDLSSHCEGAIEGACQGSPCSRKIFPLKRGAVWSYLEFPNHLTEIVSFWWDKDDIFISSRCFFGALFSDKATCLLMWLTQSVNVW